MLLLVIPPAVLAVYHVAAHASANFSNTPMYQMLRIGMLHGYLASNQVRRNRSRYSSSGSGSSSRIRITIYQMLGIGMGHGYLASIRCGELRLGIAVGVVVVGVGVGEVRMAVGVGVASTKRCASERCMAA
jgi:hypothetical protein